MQNIFIEYTKCSTFKKAKKWLEENGIDFVERIKESKYDIKKWFNTSGLKYKELNLKEKLTTMTQKEKIELLASDGMLIKRPILLSDKGILIGFKQERWEIMK